MNTFKKWLNNDRQIINNYKFNNNNMNIQKYSKYLLSLYNYSIGNKEIFSKLKKTR